MSDFEGQIWTVQDNDSLRFHCTVKRNKNQVVVLNEKGREQKIADKELLWRHPKMVKSAQEWQSVVNELNASVERVRSTIDIYLLWESALELQASSMDDLADLYFGGEISIEQLTAIWWMLAEDKVLFKRKNIAWEARTAAQVNELKTQREKEQQRLKLQAAATSWLNSAARAPEESKVEVSPEVEPFVQRLEAWLLRADHDKALEEMLTPVAENVKQSPRELAFELLRSTQRLPENADRDVIVAGLRPHFSEPVQAAVAEVQAFVAETEATPLLFSIDDDETREVDDALAISQDGDRWLVTIAIADPASLIHSGDVIDREAMRRGTTVYLPSQTVLMIPERISCDLASLSVGSVRSSIVIRAWFDAAGTLVDSQIRREPIAVQRRLSYVSADQLLNNPNNPPEEQATAEALRNLLKIAQGLQAWRSQEGSFTLQRPEIKVSIDDNKQVSVSLIDKDSPSRLLVAEMMIIANHIAAKYAATHQVPFIYRIQDAPTEPLTPELLAEPLGFYKARKLMRASTLSLQVGMHSGLGLSMYTQLSSPLRRFADLVMQRQLLAHLTGEPLPYNQDELFKVLATAERTAKEAKMAENDAKRRWFMEFLRQNYIDKVLEVQLLDNVKNGYKVDILPWGIEGFLGSMASLELGTKVEVVIDKIKPKTGQVRFKLAPKSTLN